MGFIFIMIISMVALCKELECRLQAAAHHLGCTYALFCPPAKQCCLFVVVVDQAPLWLTLASSIACQAGTSAVIMLKSALCTENVQVTVLTRCNNKDS